MASDVPLNVFVPRQLFNESSGYLTGYTDPKNGFIYVSGISRKRGDSSTSKSVGFWCKEQDTCPPISRLKSDPYWISMKPTSSTKLSCSLQVKLSSGYAQCKPVVCIIFDPPEITTSFILNRIRSQACEDCGDTTKKDSVTDRTHAKVGHVPIDCISYLKVVLDTPHQDDIKPSDESKIFYSTKQKSNSRFQCGLPKCILWMAVCLESFFKSGSHAFKVCCSPLPKVLHIPSIVQYMQDKSRRWKACYRMEKSNQFSKFLCYNCYSQQILDSCLGLTMIYLVTRYAVHHQAAVYVLDWADRVAGQLSDLVHWLMVGAPAGLKLNAQLTKFLGHLFIYHIYLWTGYLALLRTVMSSLLWSCCLVGVMGLSAQLCLLRDLLSMLTLHIYCFYVYAAKIFGLQMYILGALWRLFRGKKWNVLRSRVDSAAYSTGQLFAGTLFFTVLLFLLPTTALYYTIFTLVGSLRLAALSVQGCIAYVVDFITAIPIFTILLRIVRPKLVAGNVRFTLKGCSQDEDCLLLEMESCQISLSELLSVTKPFLGCMTKQGPSWSEFLSNLASGKLIYPWVEPHSSSGSHKKAD